MTGRIRADLGSTETGLHFQISKLLGGSAIAAIAATGALIVMVITDLPGRPPPLGPNGQPPPPPDLQALAIFPVVTGLFVLAWLAVLIAFSRDQVLRRLQARGAHADPDAIERETRELFAELRRELAEDRQRELADLEDRIASLTAEYGEQRETDGYLNGMRRASLPGQGGADIRSIRRIPPGD
jgi:hypothetical protein